MGNNEDGKFCMPEKSFSTAPDQSNIHVSPDWAAMQDQSNIHVYPDWAAMQAYYGPRLAIPPYVNSAVVPGHAPHPYIWGPLQPMMPPYGTPYLGVYAHGGVYPHPGVPIVSHPQAHGMTSSSAVSQTMDTASLSMDASAECSGNTDQGLTSQLKGFNSLGMSIGNCSVDNIDGTDHGLSQRTLLNPVKDNEYRLIVTFMPCCAQTEGSSDGSNIHTAEVGENTRRRSRETTPNNCGDGKSRTLSSPQRTREVNGDSVKGTSVAVNPGNTAEELAGTVFSSTTLDLRNSVGTLMKPSPANVSAVPGDAWLQNERELKQEKRKQSNRESARRSRLRKQGRLKNILGQAEDGTLGKIDDEKLKPVSTADRLARVDNNDSFNRTTEDGDVHENNNTTGEKLHQLLHASPRTDHAVAAR
ncbi:hypothetical protein CQW23_12609 [Capsicum baccatum]|uniref:BZIP domain-containing protein n=1 Tax=Capsicum baccatum TaxID=33114 RepID=A0A2G2WT86_CAPBA|nr:hypothetical protein CQW23_12609 [Capsicum baccatum]